MFAVFVSCTAVLQFPPLLKSFDPPLVLVVLIGLVYVSSVNLSLLLKYVWQNKNSAVTSTKVIVHHSDTLAVVLG